MLHLLYGTGILLLTLVGGHEMDQEEHSKVITMNLQLSFR